MNAITKFIAPVLLGLFAFSCSDEPTPFDKRDYNSVVAKECLLNMPDTYYVNTEREVWRKDKNTDYKWKPNWETVDGYYGFMPPAVQTYKGKLYTPLLDWTGAGRTIFNKALAMYNGKMKTGYQVFVNRSFDVENGIMSVFKKQFAYEVFTEKKIVIREIPECVNPDDDRKPGLSSVYAYEPKASVNLEDPKFLRFENIEAAYEWMAEAFIDVFGESGNMNVLAPDGVVYDYPIIYVPEALREECEHVMARQMPI